MQPGDLWAKERRAGRKEQNPGPLATDSVHHSNKREGPGDGRTLGKEMSQPLLMTVRIIAAKEGRSASTGPQAPRL